MSLKRATQRLTAAPVTKRGDVLDTLTVADAVIIGEFTNSLATPELRKALSIERQTFDVRTSSLKGDAVVFDIVSLRSDGSVSSYRKGAARTPELAARVIELQWQRVTATFTSRYDSSSGLEWNELVSIEPLA